MVPLKVIVLALISVAAATDVQQCPGKKFQDLAEKVQLNPCRKLPCRLKKGTNPRITINFVSEKDLADVVNQVTAILFDDVSLPFVGVDGLSICDKIYSESGEKVSCPLKAGTKYTYKDSFPVLPVYPSTNLKIHWALVGGGKDIICFDIPARIA